MILERMLEDSGLRKGSDYIIRPTYSREDGTRAQPDAVVFLPEGRNLVIDSKASLTAYDEYVRAEDEITKAAYLGRHADALRNHLGGLSITEYQKLPDLNSPDFIVMFVPIEPAFIVGVKHDKKLWQDARNKNVLMVSPSSLFFVIRIVKNLWTQDAQKKNFQEIARRGGLLYDKFAGFIEDMRALGESLNSARAEYERAFSKFWKGKGNVISQAQKLRDLGVTPSKLLFVEVADLASDAEPATADAAELEATD
jgi:DNA recombination protein RmuC